LLSLRQLEKEINIASNLASHVKEGPMDFSIALSALWLIVLKRPFIAYVLTGRNDLSVPKMLEGITGIPIQGLESLPARKWSLSQDIRGRGSVEEEKEMDPPNDPQEEDHGDDFLGDLSSVDSDDEPQSPGDSPDSTDQTNLDTKPAAKSSEPSETASAKRSTATAKTPTIASETINRASSGFMNALTNISQKVLSNNPPASPPRISKVASSNVSTPTANTDVSTPSTPHGNHEFTIKLDPLFIQQATAKVDVNIFKKPTLKIADIETIHGIVHVFLKDLADTNEEHKIAFEEAPDVALAATLRKIKKHFVVEGSIELKEIMIICENNDNW
jgi:hypothetical protein